MKRIQRPYWLIALFGFLATLGLIFVSYLFSSDRLLPVPFGLELGFIATYYLFSLTFFVIFIAAAAAKRKSIHKGQPSRWFGFALLGYSIGSVLGSLVFLFVLDLLLV